MFSSQSDQRFCTMLITLNYIHHSVPVIVRRKKFYIQVSLQTKMEINNGWQMRVCVCACEWFGEAGNLLFVQQKILIIK